MNIRTIGAAFGALTLSLVMLGGAPSYGASPSQIACEDAGGTFDRDGGQVTCTYPTVSDPVGNSENSGGKSQTNDTTSSETSNGTLNNKPKHKDESECTGPGNSGPGGGQCP